MRVFNRNLLNSLLLSVGLTAHSAAAALSSDKDQPIEIEADSAELDDKQGVTVYRGGVVVTQGSMRITGDIMTVHYTENQELDHVIVEGRPAHYRQLPDHSKIHDEAWAKRMEYYAKQGLVVLIDDAKVKQENVPSMTAERIEYDTINSRVRARSAPAASGREAGEAAPRPGERVRIIITPRKKTESE